MIIDNNKIKLWSSIGSRASFGLAAFELAKNNNNLMIVTADVSTSAGLDRYKKKYPNNYVDVGIGEQNMMSVASGLASEDFDVITTTFSPFQTLRCAEQIKVNLGYMKNSYSGDFKNDAYHGKGHLNFSEWGLYPAGKKDHKMDELIEMVEKKEMPLDSYTWTHGDAKLSDEQIKELTTWVALLRLKFQAEKAQ